MVIYEKVFENLEKMEESSSYNDKQRHLSEVVSHPYGEYFMRQMFSQYTIYGLGQRSFEKIFDYDKDRHGTFKDTGEMVGNFCSNNKLILQLSELKTFIEQIIHTNGKDTLDVLETIKSYDKIFVKWLTRLLLKSPNSGISVNTLNKVLKELGKEEIEIFSVQLCTSIAIPKYDPNDTKYFEKVVAAVNKKLKKPYFAGKKYDGLRAYTIKRGDKIKIYSRNGQEIEYLPEIKEELIKLYPDKDMILDGEAVSKTFNDVQHRIGRSKETLNDMDNLEYRVFDILELNGSSLKEKSQIVRYNILKDILKFSSIIKLEETETIEQDVELINVFRRIVEEKQEGLVLKDPSKPYEYDSRKFWFKLKPYYENSFEIIDFKYGTGKYKDIISKLVVKDKAGKIESSVGSGVKDADREVFMNMHKERKLIGSIVDVKYNEITTTQPKKRLRFPRFLKIRTDKDEADDIL